MAGRRRALRRRRLGAGTILRRRDQDRRAERSSSCCALAPIGPATEVASGAPARPLAFSLPACRSQSRGAIKKGQAMKHGLRTWLAAGALCVAAGSAQAQYSDGVIKIGVLNDLARVVRSRQSAPRLR